jgi:hypothetical protein
VGPAAAGSPHRTENEDDVNADHRERLDDIARKVAELRGYL